MEGDLLQLSETDTNSPEAGHETAANTQTRHKRRYRQSVIERVINTSRLTT